VFGRDPDDDNDGELSDAAAVGVNVDDCATVVNVALPTTLVMIDDDKIGYMV
jgi:hypothetical protein